jgi:phosphoglycolate phosphatase-like HAD superfamily hydrolase
MTLSPRPPLILDADGVFLSERPYWNAALGTAIQSAGLAELVDGRWDRLADVAFGPAALQRVTKVAGCNSNWDLAAVLVRALEVPHWRTSLAGLLAHAGRELEAMRSLARAGRCLLRPRSELDDPLEAFDIERRSAFYREVADRFQRVLNGKAGLDWSFDRWQLREPAGRTRRALEDLREAGYVLRVCTGRDHFETVAPIRLLDLEDLLPAEGITCADDVDRAEKVTGEPGLGKPHWFPVACAAAGFDRAVGALRGERDLRGSGLYAGDAWADYVAVRGCRERGLEIGYVHVRSGVTTPEQERIIAADPATLGVVSSLDESLPLLVEVTA